jgi:type IV secretion system protein VirB5
MNTYLKIALLCVSVLAVGLLVLNFRTQAKYEHVKPLVIRIDDVGRAQAVQYDSLTYRPQGQAPELKYFLVQFVTKYFARRRATVKQAYAESLYFLDAPLADATIAQDQRAQTIEKFLSDAADETDVEVKNVTLDDLKAPSAITRSGHEKRSWHSSPSCCATRCPPRSCRSIRWG